MNYRYGSVALDSGDISLISKLKKIAHFDLEKYPRIEIKFGKRSFDGLRPNFFKYSSPEFQETLFSLVGRLSSKVGIEDPLFIPYCDVHTSYDVPWHQDNSTFSKVNQDDSIFFDAKSPCLKFYIKFPLSPFNLCVRNDLDGSLTRLVSNNNTLAFFDVRATHRTYSRFLRLITLSCLNERIELRCNKILSILLKILGLGRSIYCANLYFLVAPRDPIWSEYVNREIQRAEDQIFSC